MKKCILFIIVILLTANFSLAATAKKISLNKGSLYLLLLDNEPANFKISNPNVLQIQIIPTIDNNKQQILLKTLSYGTSAFEAQTSNGSYKYDCTVTDGIVTVDDEFFEIEKPKNEDSK